jgi:Holliday junction resolvase RusA-like endonuclease
MEGTVEDFMEVRSPNGRTVSFVMTGDPPSQERTRMVFMRTLRPRLFDPSGRKKRLFKQKVRDIMILYGLTFPYFTDDEPIALHLLLVLPRRKQDWMVRDGVTVLRPSAQTFPRKKDVDNMLKFVMDALQEVLYNNDNTVVTISASKTYPEIADAGGWMYVQLRTSDEVLPPLATGYYV